MATASSSSRIRAATPFLTRAGSFVPDGEGRLVNAAGFYLMGYSYANGTPSAVTNGFGGLEPVLISQTELTAVPSTNGIFTANLPADAAVVAAGQPALGERRDRHLFGEILAGRLRQSRQRGAARRLFHQDRHQHLGSRGLRPGQRGAGTSFPYTRRRRSPRQTLTFDATTGKLTGASADDIVIPGAERRAAHPRPGQD